MPGVSPLDFPSLAGKTLLIGRNTSFGARKVPRVPRSRSRAASPRSDIVFRAFASGPER